MVFVIILLFTLILLTNFLSNFKLGRIINFLITLTLLYVIFLPITYTPDKIIYTYLLNDQEIRIGLEPTFQIISAYIYKNRLDYEFLHITFSAIYNFIFLLFIHKLSKNIFVTTLLFIPLVFIFHSTQLRYFLGYYAILLGFYYLYVQQKKSLAITFMLFGILSHYSLVLFIPLYFLYHIKGNFFKKIFSITLIIFVGYTFLTSVLFPFLGNIRFISYLKGDLVSTYLGGLFNFLPFIPLYILINEYYHIRIKLDKTLQEDKVFNFLYKMSIFPIIFIGLSFTVQVLGHRMMITGLLFPILLFFYKFNKIRSASNKIKFGIVFFFLYLVFFLHLNYSTALFLDNWESVDEMLKIIESNEIIKNIIN
ncbi:EpsG family protein [Empedobacter falsenii]|uniref:EpsG family protein n=1 Tax=Empedobacter falsenii TaxID=343874 RepID=A0AAW7DJR8_9FLAO|nr:EpsG family protein [Empedobacter falsenii]MDM1552249.1 EpsG family protein [Empedobacter falsenii]